MTTLHGLETVLDVRVRSKGHRAPRWLVICLFFAPMLLVATNGSFSFEEGSQLTSSSGSHSRLVAVQRAGDQGSVRVQSYLFYALVGCAALWTQRQLLTQWRGAKFLVVIPMVCLASTLWSVDPEHSLRRAVFAMLTSVLVLAFHARFSPQQAMGFFMLLGVVVSALSLFTVIVLPQHGLAVEAAHTGAWRGVYNHKNQYGSALVLFLTPALYTRWSYPFPLIKRFGYVALIVSQLIQSRSRTAWVVAAELLMVVAALEICSRFGRRTIQSMLVPLLGFMCCLGIFAYWRLPALLVALGMDSTLTGRVEIWLGVLTSIASRPLLGYGYDAYWSSGPGQVISLLLRWDVPSAHNGFLEVALELGVVGLVPLLCLCAVLARNILKVLKPQMPNYVKWYIAVVVVVLLNSIDEAMLVRPLGFEWMMLMIAYLGLRAVTDRRATAGQNKGE